MDPLRNDPSGEHGIWRHHASRIKHQVIAVREPSGWREGKSEEEDEHAGQEDKHESLELVPPNLFEPQRLRRDHDSSRPFVRPCSGCRLDRRRFVGGDVGGGRGDGFVHVRLSVRVPPKGRMRVKRDHEGMEGRGGGDCRRQLDVGG